MGQLGFVPARQDGVCATVMNVRWTQILDSGMAVLLVVPGYERSQERQGVLKAAEAVGKIRVILRRFYLALREWI